MVEPLAPDPERLTIVPRLERPGAEPRYLLVRWPDWPPPAMLSIAQPAEGDVRAAVDSTLQARMSVTCVHEPHVDAERIPVRMRHPRTGREGPGWLRAAAVVVEGEPGPDALIEAVVELTLDEALAQLETEVERRLLQAAVALFEADS